MIESSGMSVVLPQNAEEALRNLSRLLKAVKYYPPRHPALAAATAGAQEIFARLVPPDSYLLWTVRREGFLQGDQPLAADNAILKKLAGLLFARRVQTLLVLPDVSARDLQALARCLNLEPAVAQNHGGMAEVLHKARVVTIWINETDLGRIRARREELEKESGQPGEEIDEELTRLFEQGQPPESTDGEYDLARVLNELRQTDSDQRYRQLLQELVQLVRAAITELDFYPILESLLLLHRDMQDPQGSVLRRGLARQALEHLATDELLDLLVDFFCLRDLSEENRKDISQILAVFPDRNVGRMMQRLAVEDNLLARRHLLEALVSQGQGAVPFLIEFLKDARWFVVRNAVSILGEIRAPDSAASLPPLLQHRDIRVARETIRALTKIGGNRALNILLSLVEGDNQELSRQALLSLGAMKNPAAVPVLLKLVVQPDPWVKKVELKKDAIKALGEIGSPEAIPPLASLLRERRWWRRAQYDELRAAAATALGEIGGDGPAAVLEKAKDDASPPVARAAAYSLKQIRKSE